MEKLLGMCKYKTLVLIVNIGYCLIGIHCGIKQLVLNLLSLSLRLLVLGEIWYKFSQAMNLVTCLLVLMQIIHFHTQDISFCYKLKTVLLE